jgi:hypothetical protein
LGQTHFSLLRLPLSIRIPIKDQLITSRIANLNSGVRDGALSAPFDLVALVGLDEEGSAAALVAVCVNALLDCEVEDFAFGDGITGCLSYHQLCSNVMN